MRHGEQAVPEAGLAEKTRGLLTGRTARVSASVYETGLSINITRNPGLRATPLCARGGALDSDHERPSSKSGAAAPRPQPSGPGASEQRSSVRPKHDEHAER